MDLLPVVRGSLALGLPGYGLKNVERMYQKPGLCEAGFFVGVLL